MKIFSNAFLLTILCSFLASIFFFSSCTNDTSTDKNLEAQRQVSPTEQLLGKLNQKIAESPSDASLLAQRAQFYYEQEGYDEAIADLEKALTIDSTNFGYLHLLADVYLDYYQSKLALNTLYRAVSVDPERIPTLLKLSEFQLILKKEDESLKTVNRILNIDPTNAEGYFMRGLNYRELGDTAQAKVSFQTAAELDPDLYDAWIILGTIYDIEKNPVATRYFDNAIRVDPENMEGYLGKANHLFHLGKLEEALEVYATVMSKDPQNEEAYYNAGLVYMDKKEFQKAYENFNIAVEVDPTFVMAYYYRGYANELLGNLSAARNDYQQAVNLAPDFERGRQALEELNVKLSN